MTYTTTNKIVNTSSAIWQVANMRKSSIMSNILVYAAFEKPNSPYSHSSEVSILNTRLESFNAAETLQGEPSSQPGAAFNWETQKRSQKPSTNYLASLQNQAKWSNPAKQEAVMKSVAFCVRVKTAALSMCKIINFGWRCWQSIKPKAKEIKIVSGLSTQVNTIITLLFFSLFISSVYELNTSGVVEWFYIVSGCFYLKFSKINRLVFSLSTRKWCFGNKYSTVAQDIR